MLCMQSRHLMPLCEVFPEAIVPQQVNHQTAVNGHNGYCRFAFDPVTKEAYKEGQLEGGSSFKNAPAKKSYHYYRLAANIVWLVLVGWALAMGHLMAAIVSVRVGLGMHAALLKNADNTRPLMSS
jgi:Inner membrane component domain